MTCQWHTAMQAAAGPAVSNQIGLDQGTGKLEMLPALNTSGGAARQKPATPPRGIFATDGGRTGGGKSVASPSPGGLAVRFDDGATTSRDRMNSA